MNKIKYIISGLIGASLMIAGTVYAVNVTIPQSTVKGNIPIGNANGTYNNGFLVAGPNITLSTSTVGQIKITGTASGTGWASSTDPTSDPTNIYFTDSSNVGIRTPTPPVEPLDIQGTLKFRDKTPLALATIVVDDGWQSTITDWAPLFASKGVPGVAALITNQLNAGNVQQWLDLEATGWEIASHSRTHVNITTVDATQLLSEVAGSKSDLIGWGFKTPQFFVYPSGNNDAASRAMIRQYYRGARIVGLGINTYPFEPDYIHSISGDDAGTLAANETVCDAAAANGGWITVMLHASTVPTLTSMGTFIDYCKGVGVQFTTASQALDLVGNLIESNNFRVGANGGIAGSALTLGAMRAPLIGAKSEVIGESLIQNGSVYSTGQDLLVLGRPDTLEVAAIPGENVHANSYWTINQSRSNTNLIESTGQLTFQVDGSQSGVPFPRTDVMTLAQNSGASGSTSVGIGTREPMTKLDVAGSMQVYDPASLSGTLITNGTFDSDTIWSKGTGWTIAGNVAHSDGTGSNASITQTAGIKVGYLYKLTFDILNYVSGNMTVGAGGYQSSFGITANGSYTKYIWVTNPGSTVAVYFASNSFIGDIDNVVVQQVTGGDLTLRGVINGGGTTGLKVDRNGNVGIGSTSPFSTLSISNYSTGASTKPLFTIASSTGSGATSTVFQINSVGSMGIGTIAPGSPFDVYKDVTDFSPNSWLQLSNPHATAAHTYAGILFQTRNAGAGTGKSWFGAYETLNYGRNDFLWLANSTANDNPLVTTDEVMRLTNTGNLGIGTTSPSQKLDVNGSVNVEGSTNGIIMHDKANGLCYIAQPKNGVWTLTAHACQ